MGTKKLVLIIGIVFVFTILAIALKNSFSINIDSKSTPVNEVSPTPSIDSGLKTKESSEGPVTVVVTPQSLYPNSSTWDFDITLNTHSEELSEDLVAVSELVDDQGRSYKPASWEGTPPGGHHREGILKFNPISPKPKSLELKIKNVGGTPERSLKWNL